MSEEKDLSVNVQFNKSIIQRAKEFNIQMDLMGSVMFVLLALQDNKVALLECADDNNKQRRMIILYRQLELRGFLEKDTSKKMHYRLTTKGTELANFFKDQYDELRVETLSEQVEEEFLHPAGANITVADAEDPVGGWIKEFVDTFPPGKTAEGRMLRTAPLTLVSKMKGFIEKYKFSKEVILQATKMYIEDQAASAEGHKYTRTAQYFISKGKGHDYVSDLATWCQRVVDGDFEDRPDHFDTSIMDLA